MVPKFNSDDACDLFVSYAVVVSYIEGVDAIAYDFKVSFNVWNSPFYSNHA